LHILTIAPKEHETATSLSKKRGTPAKSRSFSAVKLAHVCAGMLWEGGEAKTDTIRPVWMLLTGTDTELRPFLANFRSGRQAVLSTSEPHYSRKKPVRFELLRSAGYTFSSRRMALPDGMTSEVVTAAMDDLLALDPGMVDPAGCFFLALPPAWWVVEQRARLRADTARCEQIITHAHALSLHRADGPLLPKGVAFTSDELLNLAPIAAYVLAYIDRRTRRPLLMGLDFAVQLYLAGLRDGVLSLSATNESSRYHYDRQATSKTDRWLWARHRWASSFIEEDTESVGLLPGVAAWTTHEQLDRLLATEVLRYTAAHERQLRAVA
jgi:hypothetical protein